MDHAIRKKGRRPKGAGDARQDILNAALDVFARKGFDRATIRLIAKEAGVDPALVFHYFRDKDDLFRQAMQSKLLPRGADGRLLELAGSPGESVVRIFLERWGGHRGATPFLGLMRSATSNPKAAAMFRRLIEEQVTPRAAEAVGPEHAPRVAALVASQLIGAGVVRYVLRLEPIASMPLSELARWMGPTVDRYLQPPRE